MQKYKLRDADNENVSGAIANNTFTIMKLIINMYLYLYRRKYIHACMLYKP